MKKSELRQIIKEEIKKQFEGFQGDEDSNDGLSGFRGGSNQPLNDINHSTASMLIESLLNSFPPEIFKNNKLLAERIASGLIYKKKVGFYAIK